MQGSSSKGKSRASKHMSRKRRAGLEFPVGRIERFLRKGKYADRINKTAPVYLAGVLEYLAYEVLAVAGEEAEREKEKSITPRHISLAVENDEELSKLFKGVTILCSGGGPRTHSNV